MEPRLPFIEETIKIMPDQSDNRHFDKNKEEFLQSIEGVRPLKQDKANLFNQTAKAKPHIKLTTRENSTHNFRTVSHDIPETTDDSWFHHGLQKKLQKKIRMGQLAIDARLDLHGHRQQQAHTELEHFLQTAFDHQARVLLIIHGQGYGSQTASVLRPLVQHWLGEQPLVMAYCPAQPRDGGNGASYVYLKNLK